jgi:hypothetical protein
VWSSWWNSDRSIPSAGALKERQTNTLLLPCP